MRCLLDGMIRNSSPEAAHLRRVPRAWLRSGLDDAPGPSGTAGPERVGGDFEGVRALDPVGSSEEDGGSPKADPRRFIMRKFSLLIAATSALVVALPAATVSATPPSDVVIVIETTIGLEGGSGPFTATGPAVDEGLFCASGFSVDVFGKAAGFQSGQGVNFLIGKVFLCDDESGAILVKMQVRQDARGNNYNWNVVDGDGAYEDLHGTGQGFGISPPDDPNEILDTFAGRMHID
jgi:hypothetical protein